MAPCPSEANYSNEQDLPERSSDDTENDVYDQVPTEENRNNTDDEDAPAPPSAVLPRRLARTNKGAPPLRYNIHASAV